MPLLHSITLLVSGVTLVMSIGFLILIVWHDAQKAVNQFFALFLLFVILWSSGSLLALVISAVETTELANPFLKPVITMMEIGFTGSSISVYAFTAIQTSILTKRFTRLLIMSLALLVVYQLFVARVGIITIPSTTNLITYRFENVSVTLHVIFIGSMLYLLWRYRARVPSFGMRSGLILFTLGQSLGLLNPELQTLSLALIISSVSVLIIGMVIIRQEVIIPYRERISQVEAMHSMSLAVTSQLAVNTVIDQIAKQAKDWLDGDAVGIFLKTSEGVKLAAVNGLPQQFVDMILPPDVGIASRVIQSKSTITVENYSRDWNQLADIPLASETFGAVACVPLVYGAEAIGALMVIAGKHNHAFDPQDVYLLEMLGAQAAVAITHGQLFAKRKQLTDEIEQARNQLETVLTSTGNPVVAVNRQLEPIFSNPAAQQIFPELRYTSQPVTDILPNSVLPQNLRAAFQNIRRDHVHVYEINLHEKTYLAQLAPLKKADSIDGWVVVLNDITKLKELDRLKSEMVRMTSHDLKNPLQAAVANLDLLNEAIQELDVEDMIYSSQKVEYQLTRMHRIISGVLDIERLRGGVQSMQTCQPSDIIQKVVNDFSSYAHSKEITVSTRMSDDLPMIRIDSEQFERALSNLVENAIKFTPSGGHVTVASYTDSDEVIFEVTDSGVGIPLKAQARVFDSFYRARQPGAEDIEGTGLGLALVKTITENHRGRVWLKSESGMGTSFFISIPCSHNGMITSYRIQ